MKSINMEFIRYLNLFEQTTGIETKYCFFYNNQLIFVVKNKLVSKAIGQGGKNVKKMMKILKKKVKIVPNPKNNSETEIRKFISKIIEPKQFNDLTIDKNNKELIISADKRNKAALIGREKKRREELSNITGNLFDMSVKIT